MSQIALPDARWVPSQCRVVRAARRLVVVSAAILAVIASASCGRAANDGATDDEASLVLPEEALQAMRSALGQYEAVRVMLAEDAPSGLEAATVRLAADLAAARAAWPENGSASLAEIAAEVESAAAATDRLVAAGDLLEKRHAFGEVSRHLLPAAAADARLRQGRQVFQCTMTETFALWMQSGDEAANPYLGAAMPTCGERVDWDEAARESRGPS